MELVRPADSVECHPSINGLMTVGTYLIDQQHTEEYKERRTGTLYLFDVQQQQDGDKVGTHKLNVVQTIDFNAGVLDMKWSRYQQTQPMLAVVLSRGDLCLYQLEDEEAKMKLTLTGSERVSQSDGVLTLSCDWSAKIAEQGSPYRLITSFSDGTVSLIEATPSSIQTTSNWQAHDYEAWIAAFNYHNDAIVFSGGDDGTWKVWDQRGSLDAPTSTKRFDMGVTSIHCNPHLENIVAVGSYDERLRIFDLRQLRAPLSTTHSLGSGVWRVKWHPSSQHQNQLVTACMGGGFHIIEYTENNFTQPTIKQSYMGPHQSIAYGVDWSASTGADQYIGCCSFYDKVLSIWNPNE
ncbi:hypothetical protein SAMD00019534_121810 [Acytostelium subglobosum LB1]|uniref:hypothetical protein n=1 Tax=Acytostelium subglobosum LB1 TaxID=1410327 RepID=UPI000644A2F2|nr:hypothetical protein SAMD00019534_121810 [Acytostelium subglobosum LB1]GAM29005.1 hypothetical protein SAMD00019534_121810 [Acytostelium subglobosum LB1]|eukprot:XP_012748011.1 hypothetical protein SAMD00019534_121810 [Acytostelium subglobosum LB1]